MPYRVCVRLQKKLTLLKVGGEADIPESSLPGHAKRQRIALRDRGGGGRQATTTNHSVDVVFKCDGDLKSLRSHKAGPLGSRQAAAAAAAASSASINK